MRLVLLALAAAVGVYGWVMVGVVLWQDTHQPVTPNPYARVAEGAPCDPLSFTKYYWMRDSTGQQYRLICTNGTWVKRVN